MSFIPIFILAALGNILLLKVCPAHFLPWIYVASICVGTMTRCLVFKYDRIINTSTQNLITICTTITVPALVFFFGYLEDFLG